MWLRSTTFFHKRVIHQRIIQSPDVKRTRDTSPSSVPMRSTDTSSSRTLPGSPAQRHGAPFRLQKKSLSLCETATLFRASPSTSLPLGQPSKVPSGPLSAALGAKSLKKEDVLEPRVSPDHRRHAGEPPHPTYAASSFSVLGRGLSLLLARQTPAWRRWIESFRNSVYTRSSSGL